MQLENGINMHECEHLGTGCSCETSIDGIGEGIPDIESGGRTKILVVDDSENSRFLLSEYLEGFGYGEVLTASNAFEAFECLPDDPNTPASDVVDLILMDISMPGIDGINACSRLKTQMGCRDVPVIMVTSHVEPEILLRAFKAGAMDYVTSPFNRLELEVRIKSAPARLIDVSDSHMARSRSSQPLRAAATIIEYSPLTW